MDENKEVNILMIGPLPPPYGGATVLFKHLSEALQIQNGIQIEVIPTQPTKYGILRKILPAIKLSLEVLKKGRRNSLIVFFCTTIGAIYYAPIMYLISQFLRKPLVTRVFGGSLDITYQNKPQWFQSWLRNTIFSAETILLETKQSVEFFRSHLRKDNIHYHANFRPIHSIHKKLPNDECRRFIFISHVRPCKGIFEILQASELLNPNIEISIFGPFQEGINKSDFEQYPKVTYHKPVELEHVLPTLRKYDALLLPTYCSDEGYPGIILEAYSIGMPVVASYWRAIPEIVDESSGILVKPADKVDLAEAMNRLNSDPQFFHHLCSGAFLKREQFSSQKWTNIFKNYCLASIQNKSPDFKTKDE